MLLDHRQLAEEVGNAPTRGLRTLNSRRSVNCASTFFAAGARLAYTFEFLRQRTGKEKDGDENYRPPTPTLDLDERGSLPYDENAIIDADLISH